MRRLNNIKQAGAAVCSAGLLVVGATAPGASAAEKKTPATTGRSPSVSSDHRDLPDLTP